MKKNKWSYVLIVAVFFIFSSPAFAEADAILGDWTTDAGESKIVIYRCDNQYCGKVVWLKEDNYALNDEQGMAGKVKVDRNNPIKNLRTKPIIDLKILSGFKYAGDNEWEDGTIYDPTNGKTYACILTLKNANTLKVRGYIGFSLLGRTTVWTR